MGWLTPGEISRMFTPTNQAVNHQVIAMFSNRYGPTQKLRMRSQRKSTNVRQLDELLYKRRGANLTTHILKNEKKQAVSKNTDTQQNKLPILYAITLNCALYFVYTLMSGFKWGTAVNDDNTSECRHRGQHCPPLSTTARSAALGLQIAATVSQKPYIFPPQSWLKVWK